VKSIVRIHRTVHQETVDWAKCTLAIFHLAAVIVRPYQHWISATNTIHHGLWYHTFITHGLSHEWSQR